MIHACCPDAAPEARGAVGLTLALGHAPPTFEIT